MAGNLGTLWFGADIDLTALRQKIQSGNQSILDALKLNYDQQSYQQMVGRLRAQLSRETFEIKLTANTQNIVSNIQNAAKNGTFRNTGIDDLNEKIRIQTQYVNQLEARLRSLGVTYSQLKNNGQLLQASNYKNQMAEVSRELIGEKRQLRDFMAERAAMRNSSNDALLQLKRERAERRLLGEEERRSVAQRRRDINQLTSDHLRLNTTLAGGIHISTQLGSALSSLFAIHAARQFLDNVIEIGGQLEKQRISIGAILGDAVKATHLFEEIKGLALKSPFGVVELDQYTKQLAAYGFKQNELFDMTKRLADISAGAGQDIGRLTLALGHVRSATYLTGITLRQFSMNNIPMLKMLADYYSEVEKKAVSTADVQKRISKRQVSYQDVIEQIKRLTDEGGMFYNMQEKISESLSAKFKNLKDAMDIMYGEMAESGIGNMLKGTAEALLNTTRHWKEIAAVIGVASAAFLASRLYLAAMNSTLTANSAATLRKIMADKQLTASEMQRASIIRSLSATEKAAVITANQLRTADIKRALAAKTLTKEQALLLVTMKDIKIAQAMHLVGVEGITRAEIKAATATNKWTASWKLLKMNMKAAFANIGAGTWTTLAVMAGTELYMAWDQWNSRIDEKAEEMKDLIKSHITDLQKMQKTILTDGKPKDNAALKNRITEMKQVLANSELYTKTLDEQLEKTGSLPKQYEILAGAISDAVEESRKMLDVQDEAAQLIKSSKSDFSWTDIFKVGLISPSATKNVWNQMFNEDIKTNVEDVNKAYKSLRKTLDALYEYKEPLKEMIEEIKNSNISEELKNQLEKAPFEEQLRILVENGYWAQIEDKLKNVGKQFGNSDKDVKAVCERLKNSLKGVADEWGEIAGDDIPKIFNKMLSDFDGDEKKLKQWVFENIDDVRTLLDGMLDQIGEKEPEIRKAFKRMYLNYVRFADLMNTEEGRELAEGATIGATVFDNSAMDKLLKEKELADLEDESATSTKDSKKDKALEAAKTKLQQYKAFLSEYKKYREMYSKEAAISKLEDLFPDLKDEKGKFIGAKLVDNYIEMLDKLKGSLKMTTEARKKWANEVDKTKADTTFDREKEAMKENADAMQEYFKRIENQWKQYRSLLQKSGGNRNIASMAFNDKGEIWDETAKKMLEYFNQRGQELGVSPIQFRWDMNEKELKEALVNANGQIQDELVKMAKEIQEVIRGNYVQFAEDVATAYQKSLTEAQKLAELERQRQELLDKKAKDNDQSPERQKQYDTLISAKDNEIAKQRWAAFKDTDEWVRIFGNLEKVSKDSLVSMRKQLLDVLPSIRENVEATKALYEALEKLDNAINERNTFKAMGDALKRNNALGVFSKDMKKSGLSEYGFRNANGTYTIGDENAKKLGLTINKSGIYTKKDLKDAGRGNMIDFNEGLQSLANKFNACANAIEPVIQMFDALGMSGVGEVFSGLQGAMSGAATGGAAFQALGIAGPWGAIAGAGLSVVSSIVTGLVKSHDEALEEEIQASKQRVKLIEALSDSFEKALEKVLGGAYGYKDTEKSAKFNEKSANYIKQYRMAEESKERIKKGEERLFDYINVSRNYTSDKAYDAIKQAQASGEYYDQQRALLMMQRDETAKQLRDEQNKKDSDGNAIEEYKQQIEELNQEIKDFALDMAKTLYDIDLKSWAQEFGDAIVTAWENGENAADAYSKSVKSVMKKLAKTLLQQKIMEAAFKASGIEDMIVDMMDKTSGKLDYENIVKLATAFQGFTEGVTQSYTAILDELYKKGVIDKGESDGGLSSTIQGITESTADLLASYINAMRLDLSVNRNMIAQYYPQFLNAMSQGNVIANAQLTQLQMVVANTKRNADVAQDIYEILHAAQVGSKALKTKV